MRIDEELQICSLVRTRSCWPLMQVNLSVTCSSVWITFLVRSLSTRKCRWHCGWFAWVLPYMKSCRIAASGDLDRVDHGSDVILYSSKCQWPAISNHTHSMLVASIHLHITLILQVCKQNNGLGAPEFLLTSLRTSYVLQLLQGRQLMFLNSLTL